MQKHKLVSVILNDKAIAQMAINQMGGTLFHGVVINTDVEFYRDEERVEVTEVLVRMSQPCPPRLEEVPTDD